MGSCADGVRDVAAHGRAYDRMAAWMRGENRRRCCVYGVSDHEVKVARLLVCKYVVGGLGGHWGLGVVVGSSARLGEWREAQSLSSGWGSGGFRRRLPIRYLLEAKETMTLKPEWVVLSLLGFLDLSPVPQRRPIAARRPWSDVLLKLTIASLVKFEEESPPFIQEGMRR